MMHSKAPSYTRTLFSAYAIFVALLFSTYAYSSELPDHYFADDSPLSLKQGRRVQINVYDPNITREQCIALIDAYRERGAPDGQIGVQKPVHGGFAPWCVENFDGRGVIFNDFYFEK